MAKQTTAIGDILAETLKKVPNLDTAGREQIEYIDIEKIMPDPNNFYSLDGIEELMSNIELIGLQQPLRVREAPDGTGKVIVVSGHRRREALSRLVAEGKTQLREVPCIREHGEASSALQELRLIYANADTRTMTSADLSRQAERVESLLYELKKEGYEFPGRMRDHVAEACKISKSKLARLKVIREGLIPDYLEQWQAGKIDEAPAYELARMARPSQVRFYRACGLKLPTSDKISIMRTILDGGETYDPAMTCPGSGEACKRGDVFLRHDAYHHGWESRCKGKTCCVDCQYGGRHRIDGYGDAMCDNMCGKAKTLLNARKAERKADEECEKQAKLTKQQYSLQASAQRIVRAADTAGLSDEVSLRDRYGSGYDVGQLRAWAKGNFEPPYNRMPYSFVTQIRPVDSDAPIKWAETLHCSIDYLYGLSDSLQQEQPAAPGWQTGTPPEDGLYWCEFDCGGQLMYMAADFRAEITAELRNVWKFPHGSKIDAACVRWHRLPEKEG